MSEIFPHLSQHVDEIAFLRSVYGRSNDHVQGTYEMQTGQINLGFPSVGSWVTYGLGSESLEPAGVRRDDRCARRSARRPERLERRLHAGRLPGDAVPLDRRSDRRSQAAGRRVTPEDQRDAARRAGEAERARHAEVPRQQRAGRAHLVVRARLPHAGLRADAVDVASESEATKKLYGLDEKVTEPFGRQCLMARRLVERGVRFVQIFAGGVGNQNVDTWDAHGDIKSNHTQHAAEVDLPMAGLLMDLKARGLLDSTLVIMHSEFGRMPISQRGVGRDHNPGAQTC